MKINKKVTLAGDFSGLASAYSQNRPNYCSSVLDCLLGLLNKPKSEIDFADVGAGTGIWTRMVTAKNLHSVTAVEPNIDMYSHGKNDSKDYQISWINAPAEQTTLGNESMDWITMASSFHWTQFDITVKEFHRVLRKNGRFTALWNPRLIEVNPLLVEIENHLRELRPNIKRVSSGRSGITEKLTLMLEESGLFEDVIYLEGKHVIKMSKDRYMGAWESVNDLQVQLGPKKFKSFLSFVENKISKVEFIEATYLTRAWSALKK